MYVCRIMTATLSGFDMCLFEDSSKNRLVESFQLYDNLLNVFQPIPTAFACLLLPF
jgi:hypothetical protein